MRVLFVEDEARLSASAVAVLSAGGFAVDLVENLADAISAEAVFAYDAILLDRHLPDGDGLTLLRGLRARRSSTPVIVMSAVRSALTDRIEGLDRGADDYLVKPLDPTELLARLRAVLRRPSRIEANEIVVGNLAFDLSRRQGRVDGLPLVIPRRETDVLECLVRSAGRVVCRAQLGESIYGFNENVSVNAIDVAMHRLRATLKAAGSTAAVETVRGIGYILRCERVHA